MYFGFTGFACIETGRTQKDAERSLIRFEEREKDLFIDAGLITPSIPPVFHLNYALLFCQVVTMVIRERASSIRVCDCKGS